MNTIRNSERKANLLDVVGRWAADVRAAGCTYLLDIVGRWAADVRAAGCTYLLDVVGRWAADVRAAGCASAAAACGCC